MSKVSIIVPVYNTGAKLKKCLDSLVNQTVKDIEIIIINDGSTDNSEEVIKEYIKNNSKENEDKTESNSVKIEFYSKENEGIAKTRNYGIEKANSDYILFVDSDDYIDLKLVEKLLPYIEQDITSFITYTDLGVPKDVDTSFKTWMDWRCITDKTSDQYEYINQWGWCDEEGFMRAGYENDLEVTDDYYMIALGSYYGTTIGTKYRITTDLGNVFYGVLSDVKDDRHTNSTNQYAKNKDIVEFLVDTRYLNKNVKRMGSANVHPELKGKVAKIERIDSIN